MDIFIDPKVYSENEKNNEPNIQINTEETISLFSSLSYLPSIYINSFLPSTISLIKAQNKIVNLLLSLEFTSGSAIEKLHRVVDEIIQQSPRLSYDIELLHNNTAVLSEILNKKKEQINAFKKEAKNSTIDYFMNLEIIKQRIQATYSVLEDAKKWKDIETEKKIIELLIKNNQTQRAQDIVNKLKSLLQVWEETNEYNERLDMIEKLEQKIHNSLTEIQNE
ncbi:unnamed protein product [Pneumocystis jirovecii]|uniref:Conserved oligomeric Golgi complex subunit 7 n=1 Tax=Pneumocystis jirovecii TaxID=42068 RepID=L0PBC1_PNEJI|nr:unnamed protein product [Pneumocystis jirovecii]